MNDDVLEYKSIPSIIAEIHNERKRLQADNHALRLRIVALEADRRELLEALVWIMDVYGERDRVRWDRIEAMVERLSAEREG